jgi:excinuclease ABC subunit B
VETLERVEILRDLRTGQFDVLIGINLLREGLDLPEVSLVAILDADKEGFLRSNRSLTQTAGRAARNVNGRVIMYADTITDSMQRTIDETNRRREKQMAYNVAHGITPTPLNKPASGSFSDLEGKGSNLSKAYLEKQEISAAADPIMQYMGTEELNKAIVQSRRNMEKAAMELDFISAAKFRDELFALEALLNQKSAEHKS